VDGNNTYSNARRSAAEEKGQVMENSQAEKSQTHVPGDDSTHEPGDQQGEAKRTMTLDSPLAEEDVNTQEQRNQAWTQGGSDDPRRDGGDPLRLGTTEPAPTLDRPAELENKLDEVMANPHSDAQDTTDTQGEPGPLGGLPKTGSGEQDPMRNAQGSGTE
jgi:hypothetical protein